MKTGYLKSAIWNIFPGDAVRLRAATARRRQAMLKPTAIVRNVSANRHGHFGNAAR